MVSCRRCGNAAPQADDLDLLDGRIPHEACERAGSRPPAARKASTSSRWMRPAGPLPLTKRRSTPARAHGRVLPVLPAADPRALRGGEIGGCSLNLTPAAKFQALMAMRGGSRRRLLWRQTRKSVGGAVFGSGASDVSRFAAAPSRHRKLDELRSDGRLRSPTRRPDPRDAAVGRRRNLDRRLVGHNRQQRIALAHRIADLDVPPRRSQPPRCPRRHRGA